MLLYGFSEIAVTSLCTLMLSLSHYHQLHRFNKKILKVSDEVTAYYIGRKDMGRLGVTQKTAIVTEAVRRHKANSTE